LVCVNSDLDEEAALCVLFHMQGAADLQAPSSLRGKGAYAEASFARSFPFPPCRDGKREKLCGGVLGDGGISLVGI